MTSPAPSLVLEDAHTFVSSHRPSQRDIERAIAKATSRVAPYWPLDRFVAVNPYWGLAQHTFGVAAQMVAASVGAATTMAPSFYRDAMASGRLTEDDIAAALGRCQSTHWDLPELLAFVRGATDVAEALHPLPTVADIAADALGVDWPRIVQEQISRWAASHFDQGQAMWPSPWKDWTPFAAWKAESSLDRSAEFIGLPGFRKSVQQLPDTAQETIRLAIERLGLDERDLESYFHRLLMTVGGWAAYCRFRDWPDTGGENGNSVTAELLAIRLSWDLLLFERLACKGKDGQWHDARAAYGHEETGDTATIEAGVVLQTAYEYAWQRRFATQFPASPECNTAARPPLQAAFCIDVRSEVLRRALETVVPGADTIGFAGFFAVAMEYVPLGAATGPAQCPVLLEPKFVVRETLTGADLSLENKTVAKEQLRQRVAKAWKQMKYGGVGALGYVETLGLTFGLRLITDSLGWTRPVRNAAVSGRDEAIRSRLAPQLSEAKVDGRSTGIPPAARIDLAESMLRGMSLHDTFSRVVLLVGHGASTVNNPYAAGLDCGACGGHGGESNARVAAAILNDGEVRKGLAARGIHVPDDTVFIAGRHDTTTDDVRLFDLDRVPSSHKASIDELQGQLAQASAMTRAERAKRFPAGPASNSDASIRSRSIDWSQVRPEWGLAGCAAFIAAPRHRTQGCNLEGRAFLHNYAWQQDENFAVLELIMTAPMVVASWINLQYYGSTVDNRVFGSGNKTLHNVVGTLGVLEGNGGDLRVGLPWQSVHDGTALAHEPLRLSVVIEAPLDAINGVIAKHDVVSQLVDNGWLHLFAMDDEGRIANRYAGQLQWTDMQ